MPAKLEPVFVRLRAILEPYSARLSVRHNSQDHYSLEVELAPQFKKPGPIPVAWVQINKAYVSYHLMPVYMCPQLQKAISKELKARMQGKSCFNFKTIDEELFKELAQLTEQGFAIWRNAGFVKKVT